MSEVPPTADRSMALGEAETVQKAIAYITNAAGDLLVFRGPDHGGYQVPKGTVGPNETPREAVFREVAEEAGLGAVGATRHLTTDVWTRRQTPPRLYVRHFFHLSTNEQRPSWTHTVGGEGEEAGDDYEFTWVELPTDRSFALDLDDYLQLITG